DSHLDSTFEYIVESPSTTRPSQTVPNIFQDDAPLMTDSANNETYKSLAQSPPSSVTSSHTHIESSSSLNASQPPTNNNVNNDLLSSFSSVHSNTSVASNLSVGSGFPSGFSNNLNVLNSGASSSSRRSSVQFTKPVEV